MADMSIQMAHWDRYTDDPRIHDSIKSLYVASGYSNKELMARIQILQEFLDADPQGKGLRVALSPKNTEASDPNLVAS